MASGGNGSVVLFGGSTSGRFLADTWLWDGLNWTQASVAASPAARADSAMTTDATGNVVLFGGFGGTAIDDTWLFTGAQDTTPPVITAPADLVVPATDPTGATVTFAVSALDAVDGPVPVSCTPGSGSTFPIGPTTVTCTAHDTAGNPATARFAIHVEGADEQLTELGRAVVGVGPGTSLLDKVSQAMAVLGNGDVRGTCSILGAFVNQVKAQSGRGITPDTAASLVADATRIRAVLGC